MAARLIRNNKLFNEFQFNWHYRPASESLAFTRHWIAQGRPANLACTHANTFIGQSLLHVVLSKAHDGSVPALLAAGADPNHADANGLVPLMYAADVGDARSIRALLRYGANPNATTKNGYSCLHFAAFHGFYRNAPRFIRALLRAGANAKAVSRQGHSVLFECTRQNVFEPSVRRRGALHVSGPLRRARDPHAETRLNEAS